MSKTTLIKYSVKVKVKDVLTEKVRKRYQSQLILQTIIMVRCGGNEALSRLVVFASKVIFAIAS